MGKLLLIIKKDGKISTIDDKEQIGEYLKEHKKDIHLCWENCRNAYCSKCEKIENLPKKTIDEYEFISDGFQLYNLSSEDTMRIFVVAECSNYEFEKREHSKNKDVQSYSYNYMQNGYYNSYNFDRKEKDYTRKFTKY